MIPFLKISIAAAGRIYARSKRPHWSLVKRNSKAEEKSWTDYQSCLSPAEFLDRAAQQLGVTHQGFTIKPNQTP
jgi:hypothetical protein